MKKVKININTSIFILLFLLKLAIIAGFLREIIMFDDDFMAEFSSFQGNIPKSKEGEWPAFDQHSLFETTALEVAQHVEVVPEMARTMALAAMAVACQGVVDVEFPNGNRVPTTLNLLTIAESGERKTAVENWFFKSVREFQEQKKLETKEKMSEYQRDIHNWKNGVKLLEKEWNRTFVSEIATRGTDEEISSKEERLSIENRQIEWKDNEPTPPRNYQLLYENVTPIALAYGLNTNIPMACLLSSEAGSVLEGQAIRDLHLLNSIWSGSAVDVNRRSTTSFSVIDPRLTVALMAQPNVIDRFLEKRGEEARENGFLSRLMVIKPESLIGKREGAGRSVDVSTINNFSLRIKELLEESSKILEDKKLSRKLIKFTPTAKKRWQEIFSIIESDMAEHGLYFNARGHGSKLMENITRVAAVINTFEDYSDNIGVDVLNYSYSLCKCYSAHYLEHLAGQPEIVTITNEVVKEIRRLSSSSDIDAGKYFFNKSVLRQYGRGWTRHPKKLAASILFLQDLGHLEILGKGKYQFSELILGVNEPVLKNGIHYNVEELYHFKDQEYYDEGRGRYKGYRLKESYTPR